MQHTHLAFTGPSPQPETGAGRPYTVSELTTRIKAVLEESLPRCWVIGEISDFTHHSSGHRYYTLKDSSSQLSGVMFRSQGRRLTFTPEPGMQVMAYGRISVYERGGRYQFYTEQLQPAGQGELARAFDQLKARLESEGLFAPDRKRPLPPHPRAIGVVTSASGAAIRDIVKVLSRRAPGLQIFLCPARVQGAGAAAEIARAIADLNRFQGVDILIVGRGGGSPEDLWPFNEEVVARAIYTSRLPVISAVGHERDDTISDYVADYRAPTPSAAAEIVAREYSVLGQRVSELRRRLQHGMDGLLAFQARRLQDMHPQRLLQRLQDRLDQTTQYTDERRRDLATAFAWIMRSRQQALSTAAARLQALSPLGHLSRGFSVCQRREDGAVVRSVKQLREGDLVDLRFHHGCATAQIEEIRNE